MSVSAILWTVACQAPLSMGFSRHKCWSGLPSPPPGDLPNPGVKPVCLMSPALAGGFFTTSATWEALKCIQGHSHGVSAAFAWWLLFSRAVSHGLKILPLSQTFHHDLSTSKGRRQGLTRERRMREPFLSHLIRRWIFLEASHSLLKFVGL